MLLPHTDKHLARYKNEDAVADRKIFFAPVTLLLLASLQARAGTETISSEAYAQAKAARYWVITGQSTPQPGDTGRWVWCVDISEAQGTAGNPGEYQLVVVNTGTGGWAWDNFSGENPCLAVHRTIPVNPLTSDPLRLDSGGGTNPPPVGPSQGNVLLHHQSRTPMIRSTA